YPTSGTSDDWAYGELGIAAFTIEMGTDFMPAYTTVDSEQWATNRAAFIYAAKIARTPYATVLGPDTLNVAANPTTARVTITAVIDDHQNGNLPIQAAQYCLDQPWWAGGTPVAMSAADGSFSGPVESVTATIPLDLARNGKHIVFVRGQDNAGNW